MSTQVEDLVRVPTRENAETRGRRIVIEGRLTVFYQTRGVIRARCRGDGETYQCGWERGSWYCNCEAKGTCAHLHALKLVVEAPAA